MNVILLSGSALQGTQESSSIERLFPLRQFSRQEPKAPRIPGKEKPMNQTQNSVETSIRKAFELLIQIRGHRQAGHLLNLANSYLRMLVNSESNSTPLIVSVRTVRIREP